MNATDSKIVLVVDDTEDAAELIATAVEMQGCTTITAYDGRDAIEKAIQFHPQLILMDLRMPVMDGFEATRRILSNPKTENTCIVAISAHCEDEWRQAAFRAGCVECLEKPVDFDKLRETVARCIGQC